MIGQQCTSNEQRLDVLLYGEEDSQEYRTVAAHVETCSDCQQRLTEIAADADGWNCVRASLSDAGELGEHADTQAMAEDNLERLLPDVLATPSHPEMLGRIGRYDVESVIGAGGMGVVLKGFDTQLNRPVAIKVLAQHLAHSGAARQRFAREARAAAAVVHDNVVAIHDVETESDQPYLVIQYVCGESLQARVAREGPLSAKEILRIGMQAAAGLAAAHEQGVVHRDVKPGNILLESGMERVLLTDFGLARTVDDASLTHTGVITGTPDYMAPEQARGEATNEQSDLFSLGAVLYFMATGHPPFRAERAVAVLGRICNDRQRPAWQVNEEIPDELSDIIDRLLEKKPHRRLANAQQVRQQLAQTLARLQSRGAPSDSLRRRLVRHRWALAVGACLLAIVAAVPLVLSRLGDATPHHDVAAGANPNGLAGDTTTAYPPEFNAALAVDDHALNMAEIHADLDQLEVGVHSGTGFYAASDDWDDQLAQLDAVLDRVEASAEGIVLPVHMGTSWDEHMSDIQSTLERAGVESIGK